jgi:2-C-methyl-D-erythritol 4-phosphate cytidylyltransferase
MGAAKPKQYLKLKGKSVLEHSLQLFCHHAKIKGVVVVLAEQDPYWHTLAAAKDKKVRTTTGGLERCHSVRNGLRLLGDMAKPDDWVLVHDAARPCLRHEDIDKLIHTLSGSPVGGILAVPVRDTMKRADETNHVKETVSRAGLWHALTPQMFRFSILEMALDNVISNTIQVTDEAQAVELSGITPVLVEGHRDNIKITHQADLVLAELYLTQQGRTL